MELINTLSRVFWKEEKKQEDEEGGMEKEMKRR